MDCRRAAKARAEEISRGQSERSWEKEGRGEERVHETPTKDAPSSCLSRPAGTHALQANCADAFVWRKMRQLNGGQRPWEQLCPL